MRTNKRIAVLLAGTAAALGLALSGIAVASADSGVNAPCQNGMGFDCKNAGTVGTNGMGFD